MSDDAPTDPYLTDPDKPLPLPKPRPLLLEPGLLVEDIKAIAYREPENYKRWCITANFSMGFADDHEPVMVSRTHREVHDGQELVFALLVFRRTTAFDHGDEMPWRLPSVLFGEIACSVALYEELVREVGVTRPLPQEAHLPSQYALTPEEEEDAKWAALLNDPDALERKAECDDEDIPF